jgi:hypothetical protein
MSLGETLAALELKQGNFEFLYCDQAPILSFDHSNYSILVLPNTPLPYPHVAGVRAQQHVG